MSAPAEVIIVDDGFCHMNWSTGETWVMGKHLRLSAIRFQMLWKLVSAGGAVVSIDSLKACYKEVSNPGLVSKNAIKCQMFALRRALGGGQVISYSQERRGYRYIKPDLTAGGIHSL